ncbi:MAG: MBL fold metallo-hydrolase [Flavobacteriales bacterium]|nr:MBL fold metallo-hydrolase [Flavobacteriales bacterium]
MVIEQIYTGCLAEAAYYIESNGEAIIIDPLRETEPYLKMLKDKSAQLKYIFETHFHADFVSGHIDLAKETGATIVYGPNAETSFNAHIATDGEEIKLGNITLNVLHTPGHTMESTTYLLLDETGKEHAIFTGDTLFIGDVGRPDLAQKGEELTSGDLAGFLFDSLRDKIMPLPNDVIVYPAHGAGSACGKNMSSEKSDSLGEQKKSNYALRANMTKAEFIKELTTDLLPPPQYFSSNVALNKEGYKNVDEVVATGTTPLSPKQFDLEIKKGALLLDTRSPQVFNKQMIPGSISIGIDGGFAPWVGALINDITRPLVIVADEGREKEVVTRLARVGYDNSVGFLNGGINSWTNDGRSVDEIISIDANTLEKEWSTGVVLDVRTASEYEEQHVVGAINRPLDSIDDWIGELNNDEICFVHCKSGYRSMVASSILRKNGFDKIVDVSGGFEALKQTDIKKS